MDPSQKRLLDTSNVQPKAVLGKTLCLPDLRMYLSLVHERCGWSKEQTRDTQAGADFAFKGASLAVYSRKVLGRELRKVHVPLAYTGIVAKALEEAGHEVLATDLSEHWVGHLRSMGLRAEKRSFEDLPEERFDAVVCFEPYPVSNTLVGQLGMLRMMADSIPYIEISAYPHLGYPAVPANLIRADVIKPTMRSEMVDGKRKIGRKYPALSAEMERTAYDYGALYHHHSVYANGEYTFEFMALLPTEGAAAKSSLDLLVLENLDRGTNGASFSLRMLAGLFKRPLDEIAASMSRLQTVLNFRLGLEGGDLKATPAGRNDRYCGNLGREFPEMIRKVLIVE